MLKFTDNPPILTPLAARLADLRERWWVCHTKARNEKALAWDLYQRRIGYFLPLVEVVRFSGGRRRRVMLPIFTSYVFLNGTDEDRYMAMTTDRLARTLPVKNQDQLARELAQLERALAGNAPLELYPQVAVGVRCRIKHGPFRDLEGVVVRRDRKARVVLGVTVLGQGASLEVDAEALETLD